MIERAAKIALRSPQLRHKMGAILVKNNRIISEGWAHKSDLRLTELHSIHAEMHALGRARHEDLRGAVCFVACVTRNGNITLSKPCLTCAIALRTAGIRQVWYTSDFTEQVPLLDTKVGFLDLDEDLAGLKVYRRPSEIDD